MATWDEIGREGLAASRFLLGRESFRSSVSRAYFGLYALVTAQLVRRGVSMNVGDRDNPGHQQMLRMLEHNLLPAASSIALKRRVTKAAQTVQRARVVADYGPGQTIDESLALAVLRDAHFVARQIGERDV